MSSTVSVRPTYASSKAGMQLTYGNIDFQFIAVMRGYFVLYMTSLRGYFKRELFITFALKVSC